MELNQFGSGVSVVFGIFVAIGLAGLLDFYFRGMAESKARRAELARYLKWGMPPAPQADPPKTDDHLWHF